MWLLRWCRLGGGSLGDVLGVGNSLTFKGHEMVDGCMSRSGYRDAFVALR